MGQWVRSKVDFNSVPAGTRGLVVKDYGTGIMVAWDLPDRPVPNKPPHVIGLMWAVNPECPLRDGFDKATELHFLEEAS